MIIILIKVNYSTKSTAMISLLGDEEIPYVPNITGITSHVCKTNLLNTGNGVLDVTYGVVIQQVYNLPFQKHITLDHIKIFNICYGRTLRNVTVNEGLYPKLGPMSTTLGPSSMGAHPLTKRNHDHWRWRSNINVPHQLISIVINILRHNLHVAAFS